MARTSMNATQLRTYLDKMKSPDADFRCMALIDLVKEIRPAQLASTGPSTPKRTSTTAAPAAPYTLDEHTEKQLFDIVLELVDDSNSEVKNKAVDALAALTSICTKQSQIASAMNRLLGQITGTDEEERRDIGTLAIRAVLGEMSTSSGNQVVGEVVDKVVASLVKLLGNPEIPTQHAVELIDILTLIYQRFPTRIASRSALQQSSLTTLLALLSSARTHIRKRAIVALGALIPASSSSTFDALASDVVGVLGQPGNAAAPAYAQLVGGLAKALPGQVGAILPSVLPGVLALTEKTEDEDALESGLTTLETLTIKCPHEMTPFVATVVDRATTLLKYDPNYAADSDEDEEMADGEDEETMDDDEFEDQYTDDEDASWKARRSSARLLQALFETRPELLSQWYSSVAPLLTSRLNEREESVRLEVFTAWEVLLRQALVYGGLKGASDLEERGRLKRKRLDSETSQAGSEESRVLTAQIPALSKAILKQSMQKSPATKEKSFNLLTRMMEAVGGGLDTQASSIAASAKQAMTSINSSASSGANSASLAAAVLACLGVFFRTHPPRVYGEVLSQLGPIVVTALSNRYHRISLEAFSAASSLAKGLRPRALSGNASPMPNFFASTIQELYRGTHSVLADNSADADVKERSLSCLGDLLAFEGDLLRDQYTECLPTITARLSNDSTQLAALRVIVAVADSPNCQGTTFDQWLVSVVEQLPVIFRRGHKNTRTVALHALPSLVRRVGAQLPQDVAEAVVVELRAFVVDTDLVNLPLAWNAVVVLLQVQPSLRPAIDSQIIPPTINLLRSPLITGVALDALMALMAAYVKTDASLAPELVAAMSAPEIIGNPGPLGSGVKSGLHVYANVAKCTGTVIIHSGSGGRDMLLEYNKQLKSSKTAESTQYLALLVLGEAGRSVDLTFASDLFDRVLKHFDSPTEEVKNAAAFAAGNIAVGNVAAYLPKIVSQVSSAPTPSVRLLYLYSLKEAILHCSAAQIEGVADTLWLPLISDDAVGQEDGARNVKAAILGKLTTVKPDRYLLELLARKNSDQVATRATVAASVRYAFIDTSDSFDETLALLIVKFLSLMSDENHVVRRLAVASLSAAAQHKPYIVQDQLSVLLPMLLKETKKRPELIRKITMGPFTVETDDGLENRKAALEAMLILMSTCLRQIDVSQFLDRVIIGLKDLDDVKVLCYMALHRLAQVAPASVLSRLDECADAVEETMRDVTVGKKEQMTQDTQRSEEMQRSAIRAIAPLFQLTNETQSPRFYAAVKPLEGSAKWRQEFWRAA